MKITAEIARELLILSPDGVLVWRERQAKWFIGGAGRYSADWAAKRWNNEFAGQVAGAVREDGYLQVSLFGRVHRAHRLVWLIAHGDWPRRFIDHVNGDRSDNRVENLRDVGRVDNNRNMARRHDNPSGVVGVAWMSSQGKWRARIRVDGKDIHLGLFEMKEAAIAARAAEAVKRGFHPNHGRAT
jgi:hypothetical protein